jgi:serine/threonine protein kinase
MLHFNPEKRITVDEALAHPFLSTIRDCSLEIVADQALTMDIERMPFIVREDIKENVMLPCIN